MLLIFTQEYIFSVEFNVQLTFHKPNNFSMVILDFGSFSAIKNEMPYMKSVKLDFLFIYNELNRIVLNECISYQMTGQILGIWCSPEEFLQNPRYVVDDHEILREKTRSEWHYINT